MYFFSFSSNIDRLFFRLFIFYKNIKSSFQLSFRPKIKEIKNILIFYKIFNILILCFSQLLYLNKIKIFNYSKNF